MDKPKSMLTSSLSIVSWQLWHWKRRCSEKEKKWPIGSISDAPAADSEEDDAFDAVSDGAATPEQIHSIPTSKMFFLQYLKQILKIIPSIAKKFAKNHRCL